MAVQPWTVGVSPRPDEGVFARARTRSPRVGIPPPPIDCHLRAIDLRNVWVVYVWGKRVSDDVLREWLDEQGDFRPCRSTSEDRVLTVETERLPVPWRRLFARPALESVSLERDGTAVLVLRGDRGEVRDTITSLGQERELEQVVTEAESTSPDRGDPLTRAERKALVDAFEKGYFDVPRKIRLSELADSMDKSDGAMSQLLRRGLRRLVASYVAGLPEEPPLRVPRSP